MGQITARTQTNDRRIFRIKLQLNLAQIKTNLRGHDLVYDSKIRYDKPLKMFLLIGVSSSISAQRPAAESYTTPNDYSEFETTTLQSTYPGIGDYNKPLPGFEFNIPTKAPNQGKVFHWMDKIVI